MENGFRRNLDHMYFPVCENCTSCLSSRVKIDGFKESKSQKRNLKKNQKLFFRIENNRSKDRFILFNKYLKQRHSDGQMNQMNYVEFKKFFYNSPVESLTYDLLNSENKILGSILLDVLNNGLSAVYSFYDPDHLNLGLGNNLILRAINEVKKKGLSYLYLGYWIKESNKMSYKSSFNNLEIFKNNKWIMKDSGV